MGGDQDLQSPLTRDPVSATSAAASAQSLSPSSFKEDPGRGAVTQQQLEMGAGAPALAAAGGGA